MRSRRPPFFRRSLSARLATAFLGFSVAVLLLASFVSYRIAATALQDRLLDRLNAVADQDAAQLDAWLRSQRTALEFVATLPAAREAAELHLLGLRSVHADSVIARVLADARGTILSATEFSVITIPGGEITVSSDPNRVGAFAVEELYYDRGQDSTFIQSVYPSSVTGRPTLTIATPVRAAGRASAAVLAAHLDLQRMEAVLLKPVGSVPIDAYVVNQFSEFVTVDRFGRSDFRKGVHSLGIDRAVARTAGSALYRDYQGRPVVGVWRWIPQYELALLVESPQAVAFAPARRLLWLALLVGGLAALLLTLGVIAIARRATRPILAISAAAERVARGDFTTEAPVASDDEVGRLAQSFNAMTHQLQSLYDELSAQVSTTRRALHDARSARSLLQDVVDHTTALVVVIGLDDRIRLANQRCVSVLQIDAERIEGMVLSQTLTHGVGTALLALIEETRRLDQVVDREMGLRNGAGANAWQAVAFPLRNAEGATYAIGVIATDLTERARAEQERRHEDASVQQAQKLESLGVMAGGIAHDFNNILSAILGNAELALAQLEHPAQVREALDQITGASRRATDLTRQMLSYAGKASLRTDVVDLRPLLADLLALVRASQSKKVEFAVVLPGAPLWVEVERAQITQVGLNLLTNAAEAMGDNPGIVSLSAGREAPHGAEGAGAPPIPPAGWVRFSVEDTGDGMSDDVQRRIFEPFYSTKQPGRGLGLSAVTGIIRALGGVLRVESRPGLGSRFDVFLPAAAAPPRSDAARTEALPEQLAGLVLVIEM